MKKTILFFALLFFTNSFSQKELEEVKIKVQQKGLKKSLKGASNTTLVTSKELLKAACCNLAESFETNPSIDVNFSDALTGTKQIKMLGLTSPYIMITEENIPSVRGASQAYGMSFTPGTWVESIQITKGAGSVVNGYESISGQINTELLKPIDDILFFLNAYGDNSSRFELNTHFNKKVNDKWATSLLVHGSGRFGHHDSNNDGFLDNPQGKQLNVTNRWQYANQETGWVSFLNARFMRDEKLSGEIHFDPNRDKLTTNHWGSEIETERLDFSSKIGYVFKDMPYQSIGFQNAFSLHNQQSYYGLNQYDIKQQSFYSNLIFNSIIDNTRNKFSAGINFAFDNYSEFVNTIDVSRIDNSIGAFFEYTFDDSDKFSYILGGRIDTHNRLGTFFTPRLHVKYNVFENSVLRLSAGRGKRAANIFAENQTLFASSRQFSVLDTNGKIYGLNPEIAWNYGVSFTQKFKFFSKSADITLDFYRTDFQNQAVVDVMNSPQQVLFYNLKGKSFANSLQFDFNIELKKHLNLRTAYKYYDIATDYISGTFQRPLQAKHRLFANIEYETHILDKGQQWKFDFTTNWLGKQQLPYTASNPEEDRFPEFSPSFAVMNFQVTRTFSSIFEMYLGGENIGNYRQDRAILDSDNPFGTNFDASIVYAPIFGNMYYAGLRFKIK
ncbi:MAG TPA: TonB-dependent receptor [Flavobacterium sp.]|jgi:outer membrane receptor for ferrienterochelin and colicins|uniref:TonB-dependent receptor plug domain-containing protein n=1 Tax=Flavobacterium sp. TaxID=239 RepID=UPI002CEC8473|nr:TonB-dependent receptor [Flavobacterium sp.]MCA0348759.1 TonB-dependent receptor [Bacteroidota bacterium]HPW97192.1 TonB-dependent receptor [Flavobacterium sp.]HQA73719.1 TonB-dependent receptor [Flavobacterium sp.]